MPNPPIRRHRRRRRQKALWQVILLDILTAALILGIYAVFKLALPAMRKSPAASVPTPAPVVITSIRRK